MPIKVTIFGFVAAWLLAGAAPAAASALCGTFLDPMTVTAAPLSFGNYLPTGNATASATISTSCGLLNLDLLPSFTVALSAGSSGSFATRTMLKGGPQLNYNIYTASGVGSPIWGDGTGGSITQSYSGNGVFSSAATSFTAYGVVPAGQYVDAGMYSDTIMVTVTF